MTIHERAILVGTVHFFVSLGVCFLVFAIAWGTGLSDSYHGEPGLGFLTAIIVVLQAPVALAHFLAHYLSPDKSGLPILALVLLAIPSSLLYGYIISYFWSRRRKV